MAEPCDGEQWGLISLPRGPFAESPPSPLLLLKMNCIFVYLYIEELVQLVPVEKKLKNRVAISNLQAHA